ncbi:hypothetical protein AB0B66_10655 [Catellatospora sp. NPDC049111]|uniref:hypothetical protein n=1 Tax=Catellatospora sp. NPDC049111 TaxID=3155271 RepID=UPI0033E25C00
MDDLDGDFFAECGAMALERYINATRTTAIKLSRVDTLPHPDPMASRLTADEASQYLSDLLCAMMCWAAREGLDFDEALTSAPWHHYVDQFPSTAATHDTPARPADHVPPTKDTPVLDHLPRSVTSDGETWPVLAAVRATLDTAPAEFVVIADRGSEYGTARYATLRILHWPAESPNRRHNVVVRDGEYDLTWDDAVSSLADRGGLLPRRRIETVTFVREPYHHDLVITYVDGHPFTQGRDLTASGVVCHVDLGDEPDRWVADAIRALEALSPATSTDAVRRLRAMAAGEEGDLANPPPADHGDEHTVRQRFSIELGNMADLFTLTADHVRDWRTLLAPQYRHRLDATDLNAFVSDAADTVLRISGAYAVRVYPLSLPDDDSDAIVVVHLDNGDARAASAPITIRDVISALDADEPVEFATGLLSAIVAKAAGAVERVLASAQQPGAEPRSQVDARDR